jgi:RimJ/RimL family protein N-acetyltransferase
MTDPVLIDIPMPIRTPRLTLRLVQPGDGAAMHEAKRETWDDLRAWMPWAGEIGTPETDEATCRVAYAKSILRADLMIVGLRRADGLPVVYTGLHRFDWTIRRFEIGYWVRKTAQGQGYATEATNALTRYAFGALAARRVQIFHAEGNDSSRRVIEKTGFHPEAVRRFDHVLPDGTITGTRDYVLYDAAALPALEVAWG